MGSRGLPQSKPMYHRKVFKDGKLAAENFNYAGIVTRFTCSIDLREGGAGGDIWYDTGLSNMRLELIHVSFQMIPCEMYTSFFDSPKFSLDLSSNGASAFAPSCSLSFQEVSDGGN